jgi:hypothetical protein
MEIWTLGTVFLAGVIAAVAGIAIWRRSNEEIVTLPQIVDSDAQALEAQFNPLEAFSFDDLVNGDESSEAFRARAVNHVAETVANRVGDMSSIVTQLQAAAAQNGDFVASFSKEVQQRLSDGSLVLMRKESGGQLLTAVTKQGNRIVEHGTVAQVPATAAKIANLVTILVSTAHMVSGYDNALKLKAVDKRIGSLMRRQENELVGRLEAVFEILKEKLSTKKEPDAATLLHLKLQLKELRGAWFRNLEGALVDIDNPESRGRVKKLFSKVFRQEGGVAKGIESAISAQEINVHLIRITIFLEQVIAGALGESDIFDSVTIGPIKTYIARIEKLMQERKGFIAKISGQTTDEIESQNLLVKRLAESLGPETDEDGNARNSA